MFCLRYLKLQELPPPNCVQTGSHISFPMNATALSWINPLREKKLFKLAYLGLKIGMGLTFIISGLRKMPGVKFTTLPIENPVGAYFQAMHDTGFYWNFIGFFQIFLGLLIFSKRFSALASLLMMPVTVNIFLVSVALQMRGTPIITACMVLGNMALILWHYERFLPMVKRGV